VLLSIGEGKKDEKKDTAGRGKLPLLNLLFYISLKVIFSERKERDIE